MMSNSRYDTFSVHCHVGYQIREKAEHLLEESLVGGASVADL